MKRKTMGGWKTRAGAAMVAGAAVMRYAGYQELAELVLGVGVALGLIGIGHKLQKGPNAHL